MAECGGRAVLVGAGAANAAKHLAGLSTEVQVWETEGDRPAAWSAAPAHDGPARDRAAGLPRRTRPRSPARPPPPPSAPRRSDRDQAAASSLARWGGLVIEDVPVDGPVVVTLQPGVRGVEHAHGAEPAIVELAAAPAAPADESRHDVKVIEVLPPDVDDGSVRVDPHPRRRGGLRFGGAVRATRRPRGRARRIDGRDPGDHRPWLGRSRAPDRHHRRRRRPRSCTSPSASAGAVQHTSGLGQPDHIISVNIDPHCPMMQLADLAVVSDANAVLDELPPLAVAGRRRRRCLTST